jgi:two-component system nitrate/nitrite response regulator NarL
MGASIRILLVNQIRLLGNVLAAVLEDEPDMEVIGCATSVSQALDLAPKSDVILVNTGMSNGMALEFFQAVSKVELPTKVLALGLAESKEQILQYVEAGAAGYVLKDDSVEDLLRRIRGTYRGQVRVSPKIAAALMSRVTEYAQLLNQVEAGIGNVDDLTPREQEILDLIGQGLTNQQIAEELVIEVGTVKNHVHNLLQKLDASSRHEAAATWAIASGGEDDRSMGLV